MNGVPVGPGSPASDRAIYDALARRAVPLEPAAIRRHLTAIADARVIGLAETCHGVSEFFGQRRLILHAALDTLDLRVIALEASYAGVEQLNGYVLHGVGDARRLIAGLGSLMWNVEEFVDIVDDVRCWNAARPIERRARFHGLDFFHTRVSRQRVLAYTRQAFPDAAANIAKLFAAIARGEARGLLAARDHTPVAGLAMVRSIRTRLADRIAAGDREARRVEPHARAIWQWIACNHSDHPDAELDDDVPRLPRLNNYMRSRAMASNLTDLLDGLPTAAPVMLWAHVFHLGVGVPDPLGETFANLGMRLRERVGGAYRSYIQEAGQGAYLARSLLPDRHLGDFTIVPIAPLTSEQLADRLRRARATSFLIDWRDADQPWSTWLASARTVHALGWVHQPGYSATLPCIARHYADGCLFAPVATPSTPTVVARETAAARRGH